MRLWLRGSSFAPSGLVVSCLSFPRLAPWAAFLRRFAAAESGIKMVKAWEEGADLSVQQSKLDLD